MSQCLICHVAILQEICWKDFFTPRKADTLCNACSSELKPINFNAICTACSRPSPHTIPACADCQQWAKHPLYHGVLHQNRSLYSYNHPLKELIKRFKYDRDYLIASCFSAKLNAVVSLMPPYDVIAPIPLHDKRLKERTFNQSEALLIEAGLAYENLLICSNFSSSHQAQKGKKERHLTDNPFTVKTRLEGQSILLIDDLYTTGTTIRHAAYTLKQAGAGKVCSITVGR
ncbi:ComF family protein [Jeotgalibacillus sp. S-D1]|uniref:ComF family protein n=1 Tax=Jeotgalibacillus sp. S-D1 TaxID=2552189 RepID=UPI001059ABFD|nr:ComF family protein [Jeotgalibacillus sp. S-D1]TDL32589.1 ComF family protein [Jeotgalibacillus sp. S-D1]